MNYVINDICLIKKISNYVNLSIITSKMNSREFQSRSYFNAIDLNVIAPLFF